MIRTVLMVGHGIFLVALIAVVLLQSGKSAGLGTIGGGAESLLRGRRKKGLDELFLKLTVVFAVGFMSTALVLAALQG